EEAAQLKTLLYDKGGEEHYNVVSAFIKSMRGSDPDAAVYWMVRMLEAGEEPRFILRRMVIFASEDVGNADAQALGVAVAALHAFELVGLPEGILPMTQAATYLACAPKSNAVIKAAFSARDDVRAHGALPVPLKLRNAPTGLMRELSYGKGYQYPHDFGGHHVREQYLPDTLEDRRYYVPSDQGHEQVIGERLARWRGEASAPGAPQADRMARAIALFDAANAKDPNTIMVNGVARPRELVQAERLSAWVERLAPDASEALRLAARSQHLRRWEFRRDKFPPGRSGYLKWRASAAVFHADAAAHILAEVGYDEATRKGVRALNLKKGLHKGDADAQTLEDALCLAFMEHELAEFADKHTPDKVIDILRKTWGKISEQGRAQARTLALPPALAALLAAALAET
ncbi:MAG: DUF4202 family protein, partial [Deltaproteobacteria bacterium]|nr:DUF4202 family protein [Deltaproteobacteria bacterium]